MSNILHSVLSQRFSIEDLVLVNDEDQTADEMVLILYKRPPFPHSPHICTIYLRILKCVTLLSNEEIW